MPTPKQLVLNALERTTDGILRDVAQVPADRWRDSPAGRAKSLCDVLGHLIECEDWWLISLGVPAAERPPVPGLGEVGSAEQAAALFSAARRHLLDLLSGLADSFFENAVPTCEYGGLQTGADLLLYTAGHDFYHDGQIQMLELAFSAEEG